MVSNVAPTKTLPRSLVKMITSKPFRDGPRFFVKKNNLLLKSCFESVIYFRLPFSNVFTPKCNKTAEFSRITRFSYIYIQTQNAIKLQFC